MFGYYVPAFVTDESPVLRIWCAMLGVLGCMTPKLWRSFVMGTLVWPPCLVMHVDSCSLRKGALISLDLAMPIMQNLAWLVAMMGGLNGLAPIYLGGFHLIYTPGMGNLPECLRCPPNPRKAFLRQ